MTEQQCPGPMMQEPALHRISGSSLGRMLRGDDLVVGAAGHDVQEGALALALVQLVDGCTLLHPRQQTRVLQISAST